MVSIFPRDFPDWTPHRIRVSDPILVYNGTPGLGVTTIGPADVKDATEVIVAALPILSGAAFTITLRFLYSPADREIVWEEKMFPLGGWPVMWVRYPVMARYIEVDLQENTTLNSRINLVVIAGIGGGFAGKSPITQSAVNTSVVHPSAQIWATTSNYIYGRVKFFVFSHATSWDMRVLRLTGSTTTETVFATDSTVTSLPLSIELNLPAGIYRLACTNYFHQAAKFTIGIVP